MNELSFSLDTDKLSRSQTGADPGGELPLRELVIIGAGPAGLTAGLYGGRAQLNPLVLVGHAFGGQAATTSEMENYPGFPEGIGGYDLAERMSKQAQRFGAEIAYEQVTSVDLKTYPFVVRTYEGGYRARALITCTGTASRRLGVPGEDKFIGRGVSFCATCDGYFYRDRTVVVVGGGDSALDEGLYLTRLAREVIVVHRRDKLRASAILQERARNNPKMRLVLNSIVEEVLGNDVVTGVRIRDVVTGQSKDISADGVFVYVGLLPNTQLFEGQLTLDANGYIVTDKQQHTNIPGVFAAGDAQDPYFRQVVIAAGAGAAAAIEAERFLTERSYEEAASKTRA